jgi:hypothetical protein
MIARAVTPIWQIAGPTIARHALAGPVQAVGIADSPPERPPQQQLPGLSFLLLALASTRIILTAPWRRER